MGFGIARQAESVRGYERRGALCPLQFLKVSLNRFLKYINYLIGAALLAALLAGYWVLYRPLPRLNGTIEAPIAANAEAARDERGVPRIRAGSLEDALFVQGFVTAQDRFAQMEATRRRTAGELAETAGESAVEGDRRSRALRLREIAERHAQALPAEDRRLFAAYARGVNFYLETHHDKLPAEFARPRYDPRPWTVADSILTGLEYFRILTERWQAEVLKEFLLAKGDQGMVERLFPVGAGPLPQSGSNAWAVSGRHTASGRPMVASDSHLPFTAPCIWYQAHLETPEMNVAGMTVPGLPGVIIGHNDQIAWGAAAVGFDVQDLYAERLDTRTGRYLYEGRLLAARQETELIAVRGGAAVESSVWVTHHGPVVTGAGDARYALRWTAAAPEAARYPFLDLNRARNWEEFRQALARFGGPPLSFVYADREGNIGLQVAGLLPVREGFRGDVAVNGSDSRNEWRGYIPFDDLPSSFNPESGVVVAANQNPFPPDSAYPANGYFAPGYRTRRIEELLRARSGWDAAGFLGIQTDIHDPFLHGLAGRLVAAYEARGTPAPDMDEAVGLLRSWDGQMRGSAAPPLIAMLSYRCLLREIADKAVPGAGATYAHTMAPLVVEGLLEEQPAGWFDDYDELLVRCLAEAMEEGRRLQGDAVAEWRYGRLNLLRLSRGWVERIPVIGGYLRLPAVEMSGSPQAIQSTTPIAGPVMRIVMDAGDWEKSLANLTLGQSGHAFSKHFRDQWKAYHRGQSFPMMYHRKSEDDRLIFVSERP